ncbi:hypothetical protein [Methanocalculus sp. MSAO_Arc2]
MEGPARWTVIAEWTRIARAGTQKPVIRRSGVPVSGIDEASEA